MAAGSNVDDPLLPAKCIIVQVRRYDPKAKCGPLHHPTRDLPFSPRVPYQPTAGPTAPVPSTTIGPVPPVSAHQISYEDLVLRQ